MTGNGQRYQEWLQRGHDLAWQGQWQDAATAYQQAIRFVDNEPIAHVSLGLAFYEAGDLANALTAYQRAAELNPAEVAALQKIAEIHAQQGDATRAAATYMKVADGFMTVRQPSQAVRAWQQVVRHEPTNRVAYRRLSDAYRRGKRYDLAAQALLGLARVHGEAGDRKSATVFAREALALKPDYTPAQHYLALLDTGSGMTPVPSRGSTGVLRGAPPPSSGLDLTHDDSQPGVTSTTQIAQERALARLAEAFFEGDSGNLQVESLKAQALDLQTRGSSEDAARTYEEIIQMGGGTDDVYYTLGTLYQSMFRLEDATRQFERVLESPHYATAAHFAIGQCYQNQGRIDEALGYFLEALKLIDLQSVEREQADEIIRLYEGLADSYDAKGDKAQAEHFLALLTEFLTHRGWEDKLRELQARLGTEGAADLTAMELIENAATPEVLSAMEAATQYQSQGLIRAAIEELYWGMSAAPYYLPLHSLMAELFQQDRRPDDAVTKLVMVAEVAITRGKPTQAIRALERALEWTPYDQNVRSRLIDLLMVHGAIDAAMGHYYQLAEGYYQMAQMDRAVEKLNEALRIAPRTDPEQEWTLQLQRRLADIHMQRLDWRRAIAAIEGIYALRRDDLDVVQQLSDLYLRLGAEERAIALIEETTNRLMETRGQTAAMRYLQEQAMHSQTNPNIIKLYGTFQADLGEKEGAARSWEKAVELFVRRGDKNPAAALLRRMVALHTPHESRHRAMLEHLMKG